MALWDHWRSLGKDRKRKGRIRGYIAWELSTPEPSVHNVERFNLQSK